MLKRFTLTTRPFNNGMPGQFVILDCDTQQVVAICVSQVEEEAWEEVRNYNADYEESVSHRDPTDNYCYEG
jgi:hypothetical protein